MLQVSTRTFKSKFWLKSTVGLIAMLAPMSVSAQSVEEPASGNEEHQRHSVGLEDIVVTARKQEETLMNVPVAASAVSSAQIARYGIADLASIGNAVPSVSFERALGSGSGALTIRGIGSSGTDTGIEQTVAVNLDGVQVSRGQFIQEGLLDVERVEVLKGPQALFFGKNSPGGVMSLVSKGPTDTFEMKARVGYEFRAREKIGELAVSGPLSETVRGRLALRASDMRGWMRNVAESLPSPFAAIPGLSANTPPRPYDHNGASNFAGRATLDYKPSDDFTATLRLFGGRRTDKGDSATLEFTSCGNPAGPDIIGIVDPFGDCRVDGRNSIGTLEPAIAKDSKLYRDGKPYGRYTSYLGSLTLEYAPGPVAVTSVTGYVGYRFQHLNSNNTAYAYPVSAYREKFHQFSQEIRFVTDYDAPINFSGGVYYENSRLVALQSTVLFPTGQDPATGKYSGWDLRNFSNNDAYSAFGQVRWNIIDTVELAGGVRYTYEKRNGAIGNEFVNATLQPVFPLSPAGVFYNGRVRNGNFSPEITLSWHPIPNSTLYAAYKTGFKSGGIGSSTIVAASFNPATDLTYRPETAKGGELGFKVELLDNRLRLTGAVYSFKYTDLQISNFDSVATKQTALNVGGARTKGIEAEIAFKPISELTLNAALGYSRARYTSFPGIACYAGQPTGPALGQCDAATNTQDLTGQAKVRAPDWTGSAGFNYDREIGNGMMVGLSGSMRFSSKYFTQENNNPLAVQKSYQVYDASARIRTADGQWQLALIGRNLGNKRYAIASFDNPLSSPGTIESSIARGREVTLELTFEY